ncbi:MAG: hypothetical protein HQ577_03830 [Dehalococcoidia bacterium]|nr:hypothetical protein [Dehalococcoidia bacterium]
MLPQYNYLLFYYIRCIIVFLFAPVAQQRDKEGDAAGKKDDAAGEPQHIIVRKALCDEEDGTDKEQQPADKMITLLRIIDCSNLPSGKCCVYGLIIA